jgi:hypothetical protein
MNTEVCYRSYTYYEKIFYRSTSRIFDQQLCRAKQLRKRLEVFISNEKTSIEAFYVHRTMLCKMLKQFKQPFQILSVIIHKFNASLILLLFDPNRCLELIAERLFHAL